MALGEPTRFIFPWMSATNLPKDPYKRNGVPHLTQSESEALATAFDISRLLSPSQEAANTVPIMAPPGLVVRPRQQNRRGRQTDGVNGLCLACCENTEIADLVIVHEDRVLYGRDHAYCKECVVLLFELALKNESVFPPKCCPQSKLALDKAKIFLTQEIIDGYRAKTEEYASGKRVYCSVPTCSTFIPRDNQQDGTGVCPICLTLVCVSCGQTSHEGRCQVEEGFALLLEEARQTGWQTCKACFRMIERSAGCNKIRYNSWPLN